MCSRKFNDYMASNSEPEFAFYRVDLPPTPDNQPMVDILPTPAGTLSTPVNQHARILSDTSISFEVRDQYVSGALFTGGHNSTTYAFLKDVVIENRKSQHLPTDGKGSTCWVYGCDAKVMSNSQGLDILPCQCGFKMCVDCHGDAMRNNDGICPGCKEHYIEVDEDELSGDFQQHSVAVNPEMEESFLVEQYAGTKIERTLSVKQSTYSNMERTLSLRQPASANLTRSRVEDFDDILFETKWNYGSGNCICSETASCGKNATDPIVLCSKQWKPITRKVMISLTMRSSYRLLIIVRVIVLLLYLAWRIRNPNEKAMWLWGMSLVCEIWFAFSWLLEQLPKLCPIIRTSHIDVLKEKFETPNPGNPAGKSDLPGIDVFVSTTDPEKESPLFIANTILSILAADYPVEKLSCYVSDDGGSILTFEAIAEAAIFANLWVPFCRKYSIEPRNPEAYFNLKRDPYKNKVGRKFVRDRRRVKREYDEYKVRLNSLHDKIRWRSNAYNVQEEMRAFNCCKDDGSTESIEILNTPEATWMADGTHWPGTWTVPAAQHSKSDHAGVIQVLLKPPSVEPHKGLVDSNAIDLTDVDIRLPMLVYVSREKRPGYDHNKKAGAMNALLRASAIISNGPFVLNLDCDHYIYNPRALREGMCFMMDRGGDRICFVQYPQRFEGIDPSDCYANHNNVFFEVSMRALDGIQGPLYVGTGCLFRRTALYGFDPCRLKQPSSCCSCFFGRYKNAAPCNSSSSPEDSLPLNVGYSDYDGMSVAVTPERFGNSSILLKSIFVAECQGLPLADHTSVKNGRPAGALLFPQKLLDGYTISEAIMVISCTYESSTQWGLQLGWIYGSVTEDIVTGYRMHNQGWRSVYCVTEKDAFRGTAPVNLTDRLHRVLRWATGSIEIFFSRNNALLASPRMMFLQRIAYLNLGIYPFTSIFLLVYCFLPALSLFSSQFIVQYLSINFALYILVMTLTLCILVILEIKWSGIELGEWWRNEQFWLIRGTSAHLAALVMVLLKLITRFDISFSLTSKSSGNNADDELADFYIVKWSYMMIPPIAIIITNLIAIAIAIYRTIYSPIQQCSRLLAGVFFSLWVLAHFYPFAKGLMGRRRKTPTIICVWLGLIIITITLLWVATKPPAGSRQISGSLHFL
ncbi:Cellulose_synt domain-containing protein [Cephalotus follicularis]|uniref:Cellulose_synt domain-containing protein n=1 Tax=Cephalotus follicularis TaxID=3775 RepID=A0A1Q3B3Z3_CEPFO|nr:Cellulose_synt domain-containing protein [Cephalotus follicularis]